MRGDDKSLGTISENPACAGITIRFGVYSADVTRDGLVNLNDIISTYNNASSFVNGYVVTDVTGDNVTNLTDILIAYNNSNGFVHLVRP